MKQKSLILAMLAVLMIIGTGISYGQHNKENSVLPENTIVSLQDTLDEFVQLCCELPDGTQNTLWVHGSIRFPEWVVNQKEARPRLVITLQDEIEVREVRYPKDAFSQDIRGIVEASYIVEKDGTLSDIQLLNEVHPSIDQTALGILSAAKLLPCVINNKPLRCRQKIALSFSIETRPYKRGHIYIVNERTRRDGIRRRHHYDEELVERRTVTYHPGTRRASTRIFESPAYHTLLDIDIPEGNQAFEKNLCKILFNRSGHYLAATGYDFAKDFKGQTKTKELKGVTGSSQSVIAHCLGYKKNLYYSYGYKCSIDQHEVTHNFIYDITQGKLLTLSDVLTEEEYSKLGFTPKEEIELGLNDYYLYVGKNGKLIKKYAICKENWPKFPNTLQRLLGNENDLSDIPFNENLYVGTGTIGIQPESYRQSIIKLPGFTKEPLDDYVQSRLNIPDSIANENGYVYALVSFVVEPSGLLSHVEVNEDESKTSLSDELQRVYSNMPQWQPFVLSADGPVRLWDALGYRFSTRVTASKGEEQARTGATDFVEQTSETKSIEQVGADVLDVAEKMPEFPGGQRGLLRWISENIKYPTIAEENGVQGRVVCTFVVERDGSITNVQVTRSIDPSLDKEAFRILKKMPNWKPGVQDGKTVRVKYTVPITFKLEPRRKDNRK